MGGRGETAPLVVQDGAGHGGTFPALPRPGSPRLLPAARERGRAGRAPDTRPVSCFHHLPEGLCCCPDPSPVLPWYFLWPRRSIYSAWLTPSRSEGQGLHTCVCVFVSGLELLLRAGPETVPDYSTGLRGEASAPALLKGAAGTPPTCTTSPGLLLLPSRARAGAVPPPRLRPCLVPVGRGAAASPSGAPSPAAAACPRRARPCFLMHLA